MLASRKKTRDEVHQLRTRVKDFEKWLYALFAQEDRIEHGLQNVSHEVFIRLQAVVAEAENLTAEVSGLGAAEVTAYAER